MNWSLEWEDLRKEQGLYCVLRNLIPSNILPRDEVKSPFLTADYRCIDLGAGRYLRSDDDNSLRMIFISGVFHSISRSQHHESPCQLLAHLTAYDNVVEK